MRINRFKLSLSLIALLVVLALSGCGKQLELPGLTGTIATSEKKIFSKSYIELSQIDEENLLEGYYYIYDGFLYYVVEGILQTDDEYLNYRTLKRISIADGKIETVFEAKEGFLLSYCVGNGACDILVALEEGYEIRTITYGETGKLEKVVQFEKVDNSSERPLYAINTDEDEYTLVYPNKILAVDRNGKGKGKTDFQADYVCRCLKNSNDTITLSFAVGRQAYIAEYDLRGKKLRNTFAIETDGNRIAIDDEAILCTNGGDVISYDIKTGDGTAITDLIEYSIRKYRVREIGTSGDMIYILTGNTDADTTRLGIVCLNRSEQIEASKEKETIHILSGEPTMLGMFVTEDMIIDFNEKSDKYRIEISEAKLEYEGMDATVIEEEKPDILILPITYMVENYAKNGFLEDLWPYIDGSKIIKREDLPANMLEVFEKDNILYSVSQRLTVQTIRLRKSQTDGMTGWTPEEFIQWLVKNPDTYSAFGLNKLLILDYCLRCNLEEYVDFTSGKANFESVKFATLLKDINKIELADENATYIVSLDANLYRGDYSGEKPLLIDSAVDMFSSYYGPEISFGEEIVNMGYPNAQRKNTGMLISNGNFSIYSGSSHKEGAFAFIEYCLTHLPYDYTTDFKGNTKMNQDCQIPMLFSLRQANLEKRLGNFSLDIAIGKSLDAYSVEFVVEKHHADGIEKLVTEAVSDNLEKYGIRAIVREEADLFFNGQVTAESAAKVIQSRAQLLLYENR